MLSIRLSQFRVNNIIIHKLLKTQGMTVIIKHSGMNNNVTFFFSLRYLCITFITPEDSIM